MTQKKPFLCRVGWHSIGPWQNIYWGGLSVWNRYCMRGCSYFESMGDVAYERKFLGR